MSGTLGTKANLLDWAKEEIPNVPKVGKERFTQHIITNCQFMLQDMIPY